MRKKLLYALLLCLSVPYLFVAWMARREATLFSLSDVQSFSTGLVIAALGGAFMLQAAWLRLPPNSSAQTNRMDALAALVLAYLPWAFTYATCAALGAGAGPIDTMLPFERGWPILEWSAVFYFWAYPWAVLAPFLVTTQCELRQFVRTGLMGTAVIAWCFLVFPFIAVPRAVDSSSVMGALLLTDRALDTVSCALPSFHVFWAFVAADAWRVRLGLCASRAIAVMIAASCLTIGVHSLNDVIAGWLVYACVSRTDTAWPILSLASTRSMGNCRPNLRLVVARACNDPRALWYFGICLGGVLLLLVPMTWENGWLLCGGIAVAAPAIESAVRLSGLLPARIHRSVAPTEVEKRREVHSDLQHGKMAEHEEVTGSLTDACLIMGNLAIFGLLVRLCYEGADFAFITGSYLVLRSCASFIAANNDEGPEAALRHALRLPQWLAFASFCAGVGMMLLPAPAAPARSGPLSQPILAVAVFSPVSFTRAADLPRLTRQQKLVSHWTGHS